MSALFSKRRIYLDYAAATPVREETLEAMRPYFADMFANPSAVHSEGRRAREAVDHARMTVAKLLKIRSEEITFTSGGTEANNLAIFGLVDAALAGGKRGKDIEIISTAIEHPSLFTALDSLKKRGVTVHFAPVDREGLIDVTELARLLSPKTLVVTFAYVNSEIGVIQDVRRIIRIIRSREGKKYKTHVHLDASQAPLWLPCAMDSLGVDLMTLDAGKCYGPKGVGVLAHRRHVPLAAQLFGGDQEGGLRPGTENVPLIVGCAEALHIAQGGCGERAKKVAALRDIFFDELQSAIPGILINGSREPRYRVANNCNISIPGINGEFAIVTLDTHGIAASTRSACAGGKGEKRILGASQDSLSAFVRNETKDPMSGQRQYGGASHVVAMMTGDNERANNTIRFTLGEETTKADIVRTVRVLSKHVSAIKHAFTSREQDTGLDCKR